MNDVVAAARAAIEEVRGRIRQLDRDSLDLLFHEARTHNAWLDRPVTDAQLHAIYEIMRMGPTSANSSPSRMVFVRSEGAKAKLEPALSGGNRDKTMAAPVVAVIGYDLEFWRHAEQLFPHNWKVMQDIWKSSEALATETAFRNGTLQGAYLIIAARSLGLDCGPMSGFDRAKVDAAFFAGTTVKTNFVCNLGYGDPSGVFQRSPRFAFDEVCTIL